MNKIRIYNNLNIDGDGDNWYEDKEVNRFLNKVKVKQVAYSNGEFPCTLR